MSAKSQYVLLKKHFFDDANMFILETYNNSVQQTSFGNFCSVKDI